MIADLEELEMLDASDIYPLKIKAKEVLISQKMMNSFSRSQMEQQKCQEETTNSKHPTLRREQPVRSENLIGEIQGESEESQPAEPIDDAEAHSDFWSIQGDFICRHHNEPRVQLYVPKEETFLVPLKYIDVTRSTHTDLDLLQENVLTITGMSMQASIFQTLGEDSRNSLY